MALALVYYMAMDCRMAVLPYNVWSTVQQPDKRALGEAYLHGQARYYTHNGTAEYGATRDSRGTRVMEPKDYSKLTQQERANLREQYVVHQKGLCYWCNGCLKQPAPDFITERRIDWDLFPPNFLKSPVHLQHCHTTDKTEGAVHGYCNAVMWQYYGR